MPARRVVAASLALAALAAPAPATGGALPAPDGLVAALGDLHAHTGYSDGERAPADAFALARAAGFLSFFTVSEHSELLAFPFRADAACAGPRAPECLATPLPARTEWEDVAVQAAAATDADFTGLRGFEWSSPVQGHVNVFFTAGYVDWPTTAGATMDGFYAWLTTLAGDGAVATFNHPGRETRMFEEFAYRADVDRVIAAVEAFNRGNDHSANYLVALDKGWRVGAVGVTDGHAPEDWVSISRGRTVLLVRNLTFDGIREALLAMRSVATRGPGLDARFTVDGTIMGGTVVASDDTVTARVRVRDAAGRAFDRVEVLGARGWSRDFAAPPSPAIDAELDVAVADLPTTDLGDRYLLARAWQGGRAVVVTSPVWVA